jgi:hypothetical protein
MYPTSDIADIHVSRLPYLMRRLSPYFSLALAGWVPSVLRADSSTRAVKSSVAAVAGR